MKKFYPLYMNIKSNIGPNLLTPDLQRFESII